MPQSKYSAGINRTLFKALADPLKHQIIVYLTGRPDNPTSISEELGYDAATNVARHCREMTRTNPPLLELVATVKGKRGLKRVYRSIARPVVNLESWKELSRVVRETNSVFIAQAILGDLAAALAAGTFDIRPERTMLRTPLILDSEGIQEVEDVSAEYLETLYEVQARSAERMNGSSEAGHNFMAIALAFQVPEPGDTEAVQTEG